MQDQVFAFARNQPNWFLMVLARHYPFNIEQFELFMPWLGYDRLSMNENLVWTMELFFKYKTSMGVDSLPLETECIGNLPWWIPELYEKHPEYYPLECLGCCDYWEWNEESIAHWAPLFNALPPVWDDSDGYLNYNEAWSSLCGNSAVKWTPALLEKYKDRLDWGRLGKYLGMPWSEAEIMPFEELWYWPYLARNPRIIWTEDMIHRHAEEIDWSKITYSSPALENPEMVLRYRDKLDWRYIDWNPYIRWNADLFEYFLGNKLSWDKASSIESPHFPWSEDFIRKHADRLNWTNLCLNPNPKIPWSITFLEAYQDRIDWGGLSGNSNPNIPWTVDLIESHKDQLYWPSLSKNRGLPWSKELIESFRDRWDWHYLQDNPSIPWNWEMLNHFADQVTSTRGSSFSKYLWKKLFAPHLDDQTVLAILADITPSLPPYIPGSDP
ncbi:MAG: hypothetical protein ACAI44_31560 [Candidatus Sericytochromatia bacterium]